MSMAVIQKSITDTDYTLVKDLHEAGLPSSIKLSIDNVKKCADAAGLDLNDGATITVTYTAHLNDKAYCQYCKRF